MAPRLTPAGLPLPIVQAPMAGGPSTPRLAAAVCEAGGLGFLAMGYKTPDGAAADLADLRARTGRPFGVNLFAPPARRGDPAAVRAYAERLRAAGFETGQPRHDDDAWDAKLELVLAERPAVASVTFGLPDAAAVGRLQAAGIAVWVTVTTLREARAAASVGVDALVVQGVEAGGHRGGFDDAEPGELGLLPLLQLATAAVDVPLVAAGGIATGAAVAAALAAGAAAAQLGTAFLRCPEAGTSPAYRSALDGNAPTGLTRAFSGRLARGIANAFQAEHSAAAPSAYPEVHHLTTALRAAARARGDAGSVNLWAGEAYPLARAEPAGELVGRLAAEAREALAAAARRLG